MLPGRLKLEILSGPLDGHVVTLQDETVWAAAGTGPLIFPWDNQLGKPQARFLTREDGWWLEGGDAPHATYRLAGSREKVSCPVCLAPGDILRAGRTWLLVREIEGQ